MKQRNHTIASSRLAHLVPRFLRSVRSDVRAVDWARLDVDWCSIKDLAHRLKGSGATYGFPEITKLATQTLDAVDLRDVERVIDSLRRLEQSVDRSLERLEVSETQP